MKLAPWALLAVAAAIANAPLILETPGLEEKHKPEVALLKKLRDKK